MTEINKLANFANFKFWKVARAHTLSVSTKTVYLLVVFTTMWIFVTYMYSALNLVIKYVLNLNLKNVF